MPDAINLTGKTANFGLPTLFAGQSQKEFFVNDAYGLIDALLHANVKGVSANPPIAPDEGEAWLADGSPSGDWSGFAHHLCAYFGASWRFIAPQDGMSVFDQGLGVFRRYDGGWKVAAEPSPPAGGATVDSEARYAFAELIEALREIGIFPRI